MENHESHPLPDAKNVDEEKGLIARIKKSLQGEDLSILPILLGIVLIWAIFQIANYHFLSPLNLTNLMLQIAAIGAITVGIIPVLLLGELDLSVGSVSGLCAYPVCKQVPMENPNAFGLFVYFWETFVLAVEWAPKYRKAYHVSRLSFRLCRSRFIPV